MKRRTFMGACGASALGIPFSMPARGQQSGKGNHPLRIVVPYPAGGAVDLMARIVLDKGKPRWPQGAIIDNRSGANSIIGTEYVLSQPRDGTTLLLTNSITFIVPYVTNRPGFNPIRDLVAVAEVSVDQLVVYARGDSRFKTVGDVVEQEKRQPKSINFSSYGVGTNGHLLLVGLNNQFHIDMMHVPYKSTIDAANAVIAGEVHVGVGPYAAIRPLLESGRLKPLAVFGDTRLAALPNVPTLQEAGVPGFEFTGWTGVFAPRDTPAEALAQLTDDFKYTLNTKEFKSLLLDRGTIPGARLGADFQRVVEHDAQLLGKMNVAAGIRLE